MCTNGFKSMVSLVMKTIMGTEKRFGASRSKKRTVSDSSVFIVTFVKWAHTGLKQDKRSMSNDGPRVWRLRRLDSREML